MRAEWWGSLHSPFCFDGVRAGVGYGLANSGAGASRLQGYTPPPRSAAAVPGFTRRVAVSVANPTERTPEYGRQEEACLG